MGILDIVKLRAELKKYRSDPGTVYAHLVSAHGDWWVEWRVREEERQEWEEAGEC